MPRDKYKVHEVAKDFGTNSKKILEILAKFSEAERKHTTVLEDAELDFLFETMTQSHQVDSFDAYFAATSAQPEETLEAPEKTPEAKPEETPEAKPAETADAPQGKQTKKQGETRAPQAGEKPQQPQKSAQPAKSAPQSGAAAAAKPQQPQQPQKKDSCRPLREKAEG